MKQYFYLKLESLFILIFTLIAFQGFSQNSKKNITTYDIVIKNGTVIDPETNLFALRNVGINGDKIVKITTTQIKGKKEIDAKGLYVSPGFIDIHSHASVEIPGQRMQAFDGVTTALEIEGGMLPVAAWYDAQAKMKNATNYGISSGWEFARIAAITPQFKPIQPTLLWQMKAYENPLWTSATATDAQVQEIDDMVEQGLKEGALGIGLVSGYVPGLGGKEMETMFRLGAKYNVPVSMHIRNWSITDPESSREGIATALGMAASTGASLNICHLNSSALRDIPTIVKMVENARASGLKINTEFYPYGLGTFEIGAAILTFDEPKFKERIGVDYNKVWLIMENRWIKDTADLRAEQKQYPAQPIVLKYFDEDLPEDVKMLETVAAIKWASVASDAIPWGIPPLTMVSGNDWPMPKGAVSNPRSAGTYCRFLRIYVKEKKMYNWVDGIRKMTLIPAQTLETKSNGLMNKGRLQEGKDADIVIFDPNTISDRATIDNPAQTSVGIVYTIVNGQILIDHGVIDLNIAPGRPVRNAVVH